ncbi:hypothetical protein Pmani_008026 [Petrolisthes manimaculis]|uniref:Chitin-binding type-2 domain-containing protein n=1 Tax=Petrolisthes manimaculis TaxID=1843537 RepID=A0AAE1Q753_9EUCA|nr:hypothetical protein Pmani_008026 [Petrolisthes manimaculis]
MRGQNVSQHYNHNNTHNLLHHHQHPFTHQKDYSQLQQHHHHHQHRNPDSHLEQHQQHTYNQSQHKHQSKPRHQYHHHGNQHQHQHEIKDHNIQHHIRRQQQQQQQQQQRNKSTLSEVPTSHLSTPNRTRKLPQQQQQQQGATGRESIRSAKPIKPLFNRTAEPPADMPSLREIPHTIDFSCGDKEVGYYADVVYDCQVYHVCLEDRQRVTFLCPNGTIFNEHILACDWWFDVQCVTITTHQHVNSQVIQVRFV